jgi:hypothetical protein
MMAQAWTSLRTREESEEDKQSAGCLSGALHASDASVTAAHSRSG